MFASNVMEEIHLGPAVRRVNMCVKIWPDPAFMIPILERMQRAGKTLLCVGTMFMCLGQGRLLVMENRSVQHDIWISEELCCELKAFANTAWQNRAGFYSCLWIQLQLEELISFVPGLYYRHGPWARAASC